MPNCFALVSKKTHMRTPLTEVDEELCAHIGVPVDEKRYCREWYDAIGFPLALGRGLDELILYFTWEVWAAREQGENTQWSEDLLKIAEYLHKHYIPECWVERYK